MVHLQPFFDMGEEAQCEEQVVGGIVVQMVTIVTKCDETTHKTFWSAAHNMSHMSHSQSNPVPAGRIPRNCIPIPSSGMGPHWEYIGNRLGHSP